MSTSRNRSHLVRQISQLPTGVRRRLSPSLRSSIARYTQVRLSEGGSVHVIARELGLGIGTIQRARSSQPKARLLPVRVREDAPIQKDVLVRIGKDLSVEGLDVDGAAKLIRALR